ncbi:MAG: hypothetical protein HY890_07955 [Deltaproteobacteria bacterium]|nr:hypothetical protein [Deltaproteobacteria bacterium]
MPDQRIQSTEKMVGAGHPSLSDTLNRLALVEHNSDGTHNPALIPLSQKAAANGVASLDANGTIPDAQIPAAIARDSEVTTAVSNHEAAADPHTGYQKESEKGAASGYAGLDSGTKIPTAQLGGSGADADKVLKGDQSWGYPRITKLFAFLHTQVSLTGTTNETELYSVVIPGGTLGPNGYLWAQAIMSYVSSASAKTFRFKLGGVTLYSHAESVSGNISRFYRPAMANRNSESAQVSTVVLQTDAVITAAIDTTVDQTLQITGQLATSGNTMRLEAVDIFIQRGA